jgi:hypothetical protein
MRAKLERTLHRRMTTAEWRRLKRIGLVSEYLRGVWSWDEFLDLVKRDLKELSVFLEENARELAGELGPEVEEAPTDHVASSNRLSSRSFARSRALGSLNRLRTGGLSSGWSALHSTMVPRGGLDGTLAQWVYIVAAELWVPAEEVANNYRRMQRTMSAESNPPKTSERAYEVAAFVWDNRAVEGIKVPWPVLCERWNRRPLTKPFNDWRHFRMTFLRGAKATPPRYVASNEQITDQVRSGGQGILEAWSSKMR